MSLVADLLLVQQRHGPMNKFWPGSKVLVVRNIDANYEFVHPDKGEVLELLPYMSKGFYRWAEHPEEPWAYRVSLDSWCTVVTVFESELESQ